MLFEDTYRTVTEISEGIYKEKGSKFIARCYPVRTESEVKQRLEEIKKEYFDARHHCYAYIIGYDKSGWRMNDDGEPSGTAGKPIYGQLQSFDLTNCLLVVVRYFGGIKLGVSGLINAYKAAARDAIENSTIIEKTINEIYRLEYPYEMINDAMKLLKDNEGQIIETGYETQSFIIFKIRRNNAIKLKSKCDTLYQFRLIYMSIE
jgi:uncharacterized YigZ family protein